MKIEDFNFAGKKAIVRVDFNVPLDENGNVTDDTRIRGALPTLKKVLADGGALIMMSHMGKPKGKVNMKLSLSQIVPNVSAALGVEVKFAKDCGNASEEAAALKPGEVLLLENVRFEPGETKNDPELSKKFASLADLYVNDAFGSCHRAHSSTAGVADYLPSAVGYLIQKEIQFIGGAGNGSDVKSHPTVGNGITVDSHICSICGIVGRNDIIDGEKEVNALFVCLGNH